MYKHGNLYDIYVKVSQKLKKPELNRRVFVFYKTKKKMFDVVNRQSMVSRTYEIFKQRVSMVEFNRVKDPKHEFEKICAIPILSH
jgi:hypothetical protein